MAEFKPTMAARGTYQRTTLLRTCWKFLKEASPVLYAQIHLDIYPRPASWLDKDLGLASTFEAFNYMQSICHYLGTGTENYGDGIKNELGRLPDSLAMLNGFPMLAMLHIGRYVHKGDERDGIDPVFEIPSSIRP